MVDDEGNIDYILARRFLWDYKVMIILYMMVSDLNQYDCIVLVIINVMLINILVSVLINNVVC